jgi:uncharacterized membrane protein YdjX (TVP38/TMEM64 family)
MVGKRAKSTISRNETYMRNNKVENKNKNINSARPRFPYQKELKKGVSKILDNEIINQKRIKKHMKNMLDKDNIKKNVSKMLDREEIAKQIRRNIWSIIIFLVILAIIGASIFFFQKTFESPKDAADKIRDLGALGPLVVITLIALEVVIAPIPGYVIAIASGYAFGIWWGALYSYLGNIIGTAIAFFISRRYGRPLVEKIIKKKQLIVYDSFFKEKGKPMLWLAYLFPVFPADIISFVTGLSDIKWKDFMIIVSIAYIPNMLFLNYFGATLYESGFRGNAIFFALFLGIVVIFSYFYYISLKKKKTKSID